MICLEWVDKFIFVSWSFLFPRLHTHFHALAHTHTHTHNLKHTHTHTHTHTITHSSTDTHTHTVTHTQTQLHTLKYKITHTHSQTQQHTQNHALSLSHTHTQSHALTDFILSIPCHDCCKMPLQASVDKDKVWKELRSIKKISSKNKFVEKYFVFEKSHFYLSQNKMRSRDGNNIHKVRLCDKKNYFKL
jgi:hypothetical protein